MVLECTVEQYLVKRVEAAGGLCMKFVSPGVRGRPDRIIVLDCFTVFAETKRPKGGRLSQQQKDCIADIERAGGHVFIVWSQADVDCVLEIIATWSRGY